MRISAWSSDVCSSDLQPRRGRREGGDAAGLGGAATRSTPVVIPAKRACEREPDSPPVCKWSFAGIVPRDCYAGAGLAWRERKGVVLGKRVSVLVALGGCRSLKKKHITLHITKS